MNEGRFVVAADHVVTIDGPVSSPGFVVVSDGLIEEVAPGPPPEDRGPVTDFGRAALLPGFVNAHTHLGCAFLQGVADDSDFMEWLTGDVAPRVIATVRDEPEVVVADDVGELQDLEGNRIPALVPALALGHFRTSELIALTPDARRVLTRRGSLFA